MWAGAVCYRKRTCIAEVFFLLAGNPGTSSECVLIQIKLYCFVSCLL